MLNQEIVDRLKNGAILVTPNRRLAGHVLEAFDMLMSQNGQQAQQAWPTPNIYSFKDWCGFIWQIIEVMGGTDQHLLNPNESLLLMEDIIKKSEYADRLLKPHTTAKLVLQAWDILHQWQQIEKLHTFEDNIDVKALVYFCDRFESYLKDNKLLDSAQLLTKIISLFLTQTDAVLPSFENETFIHFGFDDITPQFKVLLQTLENQAWEVLEGQPLSIKSKTCYQVGFTDTKAELLGAASWSKLQLERARKENKKPPTVGIVLPNLPAHRTEVSNIFQSVFESNIGVNPEALVSENFNISTAIPLIQYPVISICFALFKLLKPTITQSDLLLIFDSPYFLKGQTNFEAYQCVKSAIIETNQKVMSFDCINQLLQNKSDKYLPLIELQKQFETLKVLRQSLGLQSMADWCGLFEKILQLFDWPGERKLNSIEYQTVNRFYHFIDEFRQLDVVFTKCTYQEALDKIQKYAANIGFQPEDKNAPIQILGILEASGIQFDYLWIIGLHQDQWPAKAEPNPFIPITLQKQHNMPHASPAREFEFAKKLTNRLLNQAEHIVCSYPKEVEGNAVYPSELIATVPLIESDKLQIEPHQTIEPFISKVQWVKDESPIPLEPEKLAQSLKGGSQIFQYQAQCPFKAFAKMRLNANNPEVGTTGIVPLLRGIMVHEVLQKVWSILKSQENLVKQKETLEQVIVNETNQVIRKFKTTTAINPLLWEIESKKLIQLVKTCLNTDEKRPYFVVQEIEGYQKLQVGKIKINIRIDRVDAVEGRQTLLIDYKTGKVNLNDLVQEPLKAPQLPLYLEAFKENPPDSVAWFVIHAEQVNYIGISQYALDIEGIRSINDIDEALSWEALTSQWHEALIKLANSFAQGELEVAPVDGHITCRVCDLFSLCRIEDKKSVEKYHG